MACDARLSLRGSRPLPIILTDAEDRFCDILLELASTADQKLIVGLDEWRGLVLTGNGLSGRSPTDIPLVDNRREKPGKVPTSVCLSGILASQT